MHFSISLLQILWNSSRIFCLVFPGKQHECQSMGFEFSDPHVKNALNCQLRCQCQQVKTVCLAGFLPRFLQGTESQHRAWAGLNEHHSSVYVNVWVPLALPGEKGINIVYRPGGWKYRICSYRRRLDPHHWMLEEGHLTEEDRISHQHPEPCFLEMKSVCHLFPRHWSLIMSHSVP